MTDMLVRFLLLSFAAISPLRPTLALCCCLSTPSSIFLVSATLNKSTITATASAMRYPRTFMLSYVGLLSRLPAPNPPSAMPHLPIFHLLTFLLVFALVYALNRPFFELELWPSNAPSPNSLFGTNFSTWKFSIWNRIILFGAFWSSCFCHARNFRHPLWWYCLFLVGFAACAFIGFWCICRLRRRTAR